MTTFILSKEEFNILERLSDQDKAYAKRIIYESIMGTDMAVHARHKDQIMEVRVNLNEHGARISEKDRVTLISGIIHACDIGVPTLDYPLYIRWAMRIIQEFKD